MIIYHQKVIFPHKSVPYSLEKIIQPHLFNIFTLKHDLRFSSKKCHESHLHTSTGQIDQDAWIGGWGVVWCQPNFFWERMVRQPIHKANKFFCSHCITFLNDHQKPLQLQLEFTQTNPHCLVSKQLCPETMQCCAFLHIC